MESPILYSVAVVTYFIGRVTFGPFDIIPQKLLWIITNQDKHRSIMNSQKPQRENAGDSTITSDLAKRPNFSIPLKKISRARIRLIVCLWTLPVYIFTVWILLSNRQPVDLFMFFYFSLCAAFWLDMARRKCPACSRQFYVKSILLNLMSRKCLHCGLDIHTTTSNSEEKPIN